MDRYSLHKRQTIGSFLLQRIKAREPITSLEDKAVYCGLLAFKFISPPTSIERVTDAANKFMHLPNENLEEIIFTIFSVSSEYHLGLSLKKINENMVKKIVFDFDIGLNVKIDMDFGSTNSVSRRQEWLGRPAGLES